jgi:uncharacterized protein (TIGR02145 family)
MKRLKTIGILAIVALTMLAYVGHSQLSNAKDPDYAQDVEVGDTVVLHLGEYLGELVQWQRSADNQFWSNIPGENADSLVFIASSPLTIYLRARIVAGSCDPFHSNVTMLRAIYRPTVSTVDITGITNNSATIAGNATSDGGGTITQRGVCWSINPNPTIENEHFTTGSGLGTFSGIATNLNYATTYYARAYATNSVGTAYGNQLEFTTLPIVATVLLDEISDITTNSATANGTIPESGGATITAKGFVWSTTQNPTTTINMGITANGAGMDNFSATLGELMPGTVYFVRAYATNSAGTAYSSQRSFTTLAWYATVTTANVTNITAFAATGGGNVLSTGGATVTARGVCWATAPEPTLANNYTTNGTGAGAFTSSLTGFMPATLYYVRSYATNSVGTAYGNPVEFTTLPTTPTLTTAVVSEINTNSATCGGNVTVSGGADVTARGVVWSTSQNPTITTNQGITVDGNGLGSFTSLLTNLLSGTTYFVRAYATNSAGTIYGNQQSFTTLATIPTVTTNAVSSITAFTAVCGGNVTNSGGHAVTARGVCWSVTETPTISNSLTANGVGTGSYTSNITNLSPNTTYYVRAYATNSLGTAYGEQRSFTTTATPPTVTTQTISQITTNSAVSGGNVTDNGGTTVTERGVCWSTSQTPTISNSHTVDGSGVGSFTSNLTNLTVATTYYVRAYATNNMGTSYGEQRSFTTFQFATVTTNTINQISSNSAVCGGNVTSNGGTDVVARGVCWHTTQNPTLGNSLGSTSDATGLGTYTSYITGLNSNTTYYVRAYATNSAGTSYGSQRTFTTRNPNQITDIDENVYNTVTIGNQIWMRENLKTTRFQNEVEIPNVTGNAAWSSLTSAAYCEYDNNTANVTTYGRLYNAFAFFSDHGLCPIGWRRPTYDDWSVLTDYLGGYEVAGGKMKEAGYIHWQSPNTGATNESGFTALPSGRRSPTGLYTALTTDATYGKLWLGPDNQWSSVNLYYNNVVAQLAGSIGLQNGFAVRCIQGEDYFLPQVTTSEAINITSNSAFCYGNVNYQSGIVTERGFFYGTSPNPEITGSKVIVGSGTSGYNTTLTGLTPATTYYLKAYAVNSAGVGYGDEISFTTLINTGTINDVDGNTYNVKSIGTQVWMTENLRTTKYKNGDVIPTGLSNTEWVNTIDGASAIYPHTVIEGLNSEDDVVEAYGILYNWYAATDSRGLCPVGWHLPSDEEWTVLTNYVGGLSVAGGKLKSTQTAPNNHPRWDSPNTSASDDFDFSTFPGGYRSDTDGNYGWIGVYCHFMSNTEYNSTQSWCRTLYHDTGGIARGNNNKKLGISVRCIKDANTQIAIPTVTTAAVSGITSTTAMSGGSVVSSGSGTVTARGIVWGTTENPTIAQNEGITSNGTGVGHFSSELTGLAAGTTYYVRAYATNSYGTNYGVLTSFTTNGSGFTIVDIDSNSYETVFIGGRQWMANNLKTTKLNNGVDISIVPDNANWASQTTPALCWFENNEANKPIHGALYNWSAVGTNNLCPTGWHVPTDAEWFSLEKVVDSTIINPNETNWRGIVGGIKLKSTTSWANNGNGSDAYGFEGLPSGFRNQDGLFTGFQNKGYFWSSTALDSENEWHRALQNDKNGIYRAFLNSKNGMSVRCINDTLRLSNVITKPIFHIAYTTAITGGIVTFDGSSLVSARGIVWSTTQNPTIEENAGFTNDGSGIGEFTSNLTGLTSGTTYYLRAYATNALGTAYGETITINTLTTVYGNGATDIDGNVYTSVFIGEQEWLVENLKVSKYNNGEVIPNKISDAEWDATNDYGAWCYNQNNPAYNETFGKLYNGFAVIDSRKICPTGWHVPIDQEWTTLIRYIDPYTLINEDNTGLTQSTIAGKKLKATHTWEAANIGTNEYGFTALPGGNRYAHGSFETPVSSSFWWSSTMYLENPLINWVRYIYGNNITRSIYSNRYGMSVRCMRHAQGYPTVTTKNITVITSISITCGGKTHFSGATEIISRGLVWGTTEYPTVENCLGFSNNGNSIGEFTHEITGLQPSTTYYLRAYATNANGTAYGYMRTATTVAENQVMDITGNIYETITIGNQVWMAENLRTQKLNDGTEISYGWYVDYPAVTGCPNGFGSIYNGYAAANSKLCPVGWHVPTASEWVTLSDYLGGSTVAGGKMKTVGTEHWNSPNTSATNESGFSGLPGGAKWGMNPCDNTSTDGYWWTRTPNIYKQLKYNSAELFTGNQDIHIGFSIRCVKN